MTKTLSNVSLLDLLPPNLKNDKFVRALSVALDQQFQKMSRERKNLLIYSRIDELTSKQLDHLAKSFDAAAWRDYWPVSLKRSVLKSAILLKKQKGTVAAVEGALEAISSSAKIVEWWQTEPKGEPHTFTIYVTQPKVGSVIDAELQEDVMTLIDDAKPLRSHYDFVMQDVIDGGVNAFAAIRAVTYSKIGG